MNHELNNREKHGIHEEVLFPDECVVFSRQCARSVWRRDFHKEHSFGEESGQLAREL